MQATLEWENQDDGFLAKILVGDNSKDIPVGTPVAVITDEKDDVSLACYMSPSDVRCHLLVLHVTLRCHMLPSGVTCYPLVSHVMLWCHMLFSGVARCCSLVKILSCHAGVCHLEPVKACSRGFQSQTWCTMSQPDRFRRLVMLCPVTCSTSCAEQLHFLFLSAASTTASGRRLFLLKLTSCHLLRLSKCCP